MNFSSGAPKKAAHHDTHALPPSHIQDAYWHYNKAKASELAEDFDVVDFERGLTEEQKKVILPIGTVSGNAISKACTAFRDSRKSCSSDESGPVYAEDRTIYEHQDFPGLHIIPSILPPPTQVELISRLLHRDLATPHHKTNITAAYHIPYPTPSPTTLPENLSFFNSTPSSPDTTLTPKDPTTHTPLNSVQHLQKKLRWLTLGTQYDWPTRTYPRRAAAAFPPDIAALVAGLFPQLRAESGVVLVYSPKDYMPVHRDVSEQCERALASFSLGCDGIFVVARGEADEGHGGAGADGGEDDGAAHSEDAHTEDEGKGNGKEKSGRGRTVALRVRSGDVVHMDGETRWAWHAMPRTIAGTCPAWLREWPVGTPGATEGERRMFARWRGFMGGKRVNISCRQVWD